MQGCFLVLLELLDSSGDTHTDLELLPVIGTLTEVRWQVLGAGGGEEDLSWEERSQDPRECGAVT